MTRRTRQPVATSTAQEAVGATTDATGRKVGTDAARAGEHNRTRTCRHCGQPFEAVREHQAFCRPACRLAQCNAADATPRALPFADLDDLFRREPLE